MSFGGFSGFGGYGSFGGADPLYALTVHRMMSKSDYYSEPTRQHNPPPPHRPPQGRGQHLQAGEAAQPTASTPPQGQAAAAAAATRPKAVVNSSKPPPVKPQLINPPAPRAVVHTPKPELHTTQFYPSAPWGMVDAPEPQTQPRAFPSSAAFVLVVDMPDVSPADLRVRIENGSVLTISGKFERRFMMPENADLNSIQREYKDGVLTVTVRKLTPRVVQGKIRTFFKKIFTRKR